MKDRFITINGQLSEYTRAEIKEKIVSLGGTYTPSITNKTNLMVIGSKALKKKNNEAKKKNIQTITEEEFYELLKPKKPESNDLLLTFFLGFFGVHHLKNGEYVKGLFQALTFGGFGVWWLYDLYIAYKENKSKKQELIMKSFVSLIMIVISFTKANIIAFMFCIIGGILYFPYINKYLKKIRILLPFLLFFISFFINFKQEHNIYGYWYTDSMKLNIEEEKVTLDAVVEGKRYKYSGENTHDFTSNIYTIKVDKREFKYKYNSNSNTLCFLNDKEECKYYLRNNE